MTTEDDIYRSSTQYRLWSFTPSSLASLRAKTNELARQNVREAFKRTRHRRTQPEHVDGDHMEQDRKDNSKEEEEKEPDIECLTVEEEQRLIGFYCQKCLELADAIPKPHGPLPTNVKATAVQYLKRFYLTNSPMTYHPKSLVASVLFLATKTENHYISLSKFSSYINGSTPEDIIAPEFLITQSLRFAFAVHHPFHGLEGGFMELLALVDGEGTGFPNETETHKAELQAEMLNLPMPEPNSGFKSRPRNTIDVLKTSVRTACDRARETLKVAALLTDVYLLYPPPQIWLAALSLHDEPLMLFYLTVKLSLIPESSSSASLFEKLTHTIRSCAAMLSAYQGPITKGSSTFPELVRIDKKLYGCLNPEKTDLVSLNRVVKREQMADKSKRDEEKKKKRKLEMQRDDVFGPALVK